jgi:large subunit ribosomal protein L9
MEVILLERIEKLGQMGDVVNVKSGFARNFLLPRNKAVLANEANRAHFESQRAQLEAQNLERKNEAEAVASKMGGLFVIMVRQAGDAGQLYGSVNARDIATGVSEAGFSIDRNQVVLEQPIKSVGLHTVTVSLHPEVSVSVTANVARSEEEAEIQERTGEAIVSNDGEEPTMLEETLAEEDGEEAEDAQEASAEEDDATEEAADDAGEEAADDPQDEAEEDKSE